MSRAFCYQCNRAKVACLCGRIKVEANQLHIIVLQHPQEAKQPKGSAIIAELGLRQYQCWRGEDFTGHPQLNRLLQQQGDKTALLYPAEGAEILDQTGLNRLPPLKYLILIDATWRKAEKIWQLNPGLHGLPRFKLPPGNDSNYRIRKSPAAGYLSTIESMVQALRIMENKPGAYQPLLDLFDEMIGFQIEKMGQRTYRRNYPQLQQSRKKPGK